MNTDVTIRKSNAPTIPTDGEVGMTGRATQEDMVTPTCSIVQPTSSSDRGEAGQYFFSEAGAVADFEAVVLDVAFTRTLWPPIEEGEGQPACRSADREMGLTNNPSKVLGKKVAAEQGMKDGETAFIPCDDCPHANDDKFARDAWLCKPGFALLLHNEYGVSIFFVKGTAINAVRRTIVSPALRRITQGKAAAPFSALFRFSLTLREDGAQKYYVPEISTVRLLEGNELAEYAEIASTFRGRISDQAAADVEQEGEQGQQGFDPEGEAAAAAKSQ